MAALRAKGLRPVAVEDATVALRLLVDRRDRLGRPRTETISRLHTLLLELVPGGAKKYLLHQLRPAGPGSAEHGAPARHRRPHPPATSLRADHRPGRHRQKIKAADRQLTELVQATGSTLQQLHGIGPSGAARLLGDIADVARFASRCTSWPS